MLSRVKTVKMRFVAGIGYTHPMQMSAINAGWQPMSKERVKKQLSNLKQQLEDSVAVSND